MSGPPTSEAVAAQAVQHLARLVAFDTVSRESNLQLIGHVAAVLASHGIESVEVPSPEGDKANLLARIGPNIEGGIVLSGHTDVVPVDGQDWSSDPFILTPKGDRLYGRGSADMKGFLALLLAMLPHFLAAPLKKPLWLAFSYDEEVGCLGAPHLLSYMQGTIPLPALAVIGEPTGMRVITAHKGVWSFETVVTGLEGHSSQPQHAVNAVHIAVKLAQFLLTLGEERRMTDTRFEPPYSTVHVGTIHGGTARNIVARECKLVWEIRPLPGDDIQSLFDRFEAYCDTLRPAMRAMHAEAGIVTHRKSHMDGVALPEGSQHLSEWVMRWAGTNQQSAVSFGTEAGVFLSHGIPAIVCGPGHIEQAHRPDEYIETAQLREGAAFLLRLIESLT